MTLASFNALGGNSNSLTTRQRNIANNLEEKQGKSWSEPGYSAEKEPSFEDCRLSQYSPPAHSHAELDWPPHMAAPAPSTACVVIGNGGSSNRKGARVKLSFVLNVDCTSAQVVYASPSIKQALSIDSASVVGAGVGAILHPDDLEDFLLFCCCPPHLARCSHIHTQTHTQHQADKLQEEDGESQGYVTFLCRMLNGHHHTAAPSPSYTIVRISGTQHPTPTSQSPDNDNEEEEEERQQQVPPPCHVVPEPDNDESIRSVFFSVVEVPSVGGLSLEVPPSYLDCPLEYLVTSDKSPTILFADPRVNRILGFEQREMIGQTGYQFVFPQDQLFIVAAQFDAVLRQREPLPVAARLITKSGRTLFSRSRVYLNLDHWTKEIRNYVTISSIISKKTAHRHFKKQVKVVRSLRRNVAMWTAMLDLLQLTDAQKAHATSMDLSSYLHQFHHMQESQGFDTPMFTDEADTENMPVITELTEEDDLGDTPPVSASVPPSPPPPPLIAKGPPDLLIPRRLLCPDYRLTPHLLELTHFFPQDIVNNYTIGPLRVQGQATCNLIGFRRTLTRPITIEQSKNAHFKCFGAHSASRNLVRASLNTHAPGNDFSSNLTLSVRELNISCLAPAIYSRDIIPVKVRKPRGSKRGLYVNSVKINCRSVDRPKHTTQNLPQSTISFSPP